jgi:hypothetical protein
LTSVFTFEKTLRRALKYCIVARGFTSMQSAAILGRRGFKELQGLWPCFSRNHETLPVFIGASWQHVPSAVDMRNKLVHGERVFKLTDCEAAANQVLTALLAFRAKLQVQMQFDGWSRVPARRKGKLPWHY